VPLVLELSGSPAALAGALDMLAHEGTALVGSWYGRRPVELPLGGAFHRRRLTIRSSQVSTIPAALSAHWDLARRRRVAVALLGELPLAALATTEFGFAEAAAAYQALDSQEPGVFHVALRYQ
jgi:threonine dehydrogenase-like Zn-dependent dehydrogenase